MYAYRDDGISSLKDVSFTCTSTLSAASNFGHHGSDEDMSSQLLGDRVPNDALSLATGTRIDDITGSLSSMFRFNSQTYGSAHVGPAWLR